MADFIADYYFWIKAFHLIAVFAWMAGLFYLPRLFVYHTDPENNPQMNKTFEIMERKLLRVIMNPAMIIAWIFGVMLVIYQIDIGGMKQGWLHLKMTSAVLMTIFHHVLVYHFKQFQKGQNQKTGRYYRLINEVPTILLIIIVICVIVKPF